MITHPSSTGDGVDDSARPALATVQAIAAATGRPAHELAPLYDSIDTDALNAIGEHARRQSTSTRLSFSHDGVDIELRVSPAGEITVDVDPA